MDIIALFSPSPLVKSPLFRTVLKSYGSLSCNKFWANSIVRLDRNFGKTQTRTLPIIRLHWTPPALKMDRKQFSETSILWRDYNTFPLFGKVREILKVKYYWRTSSKSEVFDKIHLDHIKGVLHLVTFSTLSKNERKQFV